ncbi:MAG TPA: selenoneine biosynthesis selenosugar synthase SenB [Burkholderiaceae bacterium]|nr:selenoneine biosynthesis selenosugar synthase SenB [Burkholderiaceae bacterium]
MTPALASANNGNWLTASRWARMLGADYAVRIVQQWQGEPADALIALHARRSAPSIEAWAAQTPRRPLVVVLTGTDLYRDLAAGDADAARSLARADRLIVLHEGAIADLPAGHRAKAVVCFQSTGARRPLPKTPRHLRALMVGHLRDEKRPQTYFAAARKLLDRDDILFDHIGEALDPALGQEATTLMAEHPRYRWLGALPHEATLRHIQRAHVLVHPSAMEGGAHVVMEAVRCGTPVLASKISGNVGLLGADYRGYFALGDAGGLAVLLQRVRGDRSMLQALRRQGDRRAPLFDPARERATLCGVIDALLESHRR